MANPLGGIADVSLNGITIPASLLSEVSVELTSATRERETLAGKFTRNAGVLDTAQATFTMYLPSIDYLKDIVPSQYNAPTGGAQTTGNIVWTNTTCAVDETPVNIHFVCATTDDNDVYFPNASVSMNFNPTYNMSDELTIEVVVYGNPDENGVVARAGTGDLTAKSKYNPATEATVPATS